MKKTSLKILILFVLTSMLLGCKKEINQNVTVVRDQAKVAAFRVEAVDDAAAAEFVEDWTSHKLAFDLNRIVEDAVQQVGKA